MPVRQVQAHEVQGHRLRKVRRRSHRAERCAATAWAISNWPAPVAHIWFLKSLPSRIGLILDMTLKDLERVLYFENYIVIEPGLTPLKERQLLTEDEFYKAQDEYGNDSFTAEIGAEAIRKLLGAIDLEKLRDEIRGAVAEAPGGEKQKKLVKRLKVVEAFHRFRQSPGMDDPAGRPGDPAGTAPAGAAGWRPLCDLGPERPVSPRHQPQQPSQAPDRAEGARHHRAQRKAHAAGVG